MNNALTQERKAWSVLIVSTLAFTVCFMVWMMFGVIGIPIKKMLNLNATEFGLLTATPVLTGSLIRVPLGIWTDRFGGRIVMALLMALTVPAIWLMAYATQYWHFLVIGLFVGLAGGSFSVGTPYVARWFPPKRQGMAMGIYGAGNSGSAVNKFVAPVILVAFGWTVVPQVYAAIMAGTGVAAKHGILIKDAQALEVAHKVDTVAFDKTGTLTIGQPRLLSLLALQDLDVVHAPDAAAEMTDHAQTLLALAAGLQSGSEHPLAHAVVQAAKTHGLSYATPEGVKAVAGFGSEGVVQGRHLLLGSLRWMDALSVPAGEWQARAAALQAQGATVSVLAERTPQGVVALAVLAFGDEPKPGVHEALTKLRARGLRLAMISGDNVGAAQAMAARLGLHTDEVHAEVMPGDKAALVKRLQRNVGGAPHVVAFVGDGINDAPALAAADVGLAMANLNADGQRGGTDVAMQAAGITLMRGDVALVAGALDISARTVAKIRQNLFWAFVYNAAGIPLAAMGYLSPVVAGAAMALSSVSVMTNALLLKRWKP